MIYIVEYPMDDGRPRAWCAENEIALKHAVSAALDVSEIVRQTLDCVLRRNASTLARMLYYPTEQAAIEALDDLRTWEDPRGAVPLLDILLENGAIIHNQKNKEDGS